ncbi:hypothetical protein ABMA28_003976 [Loxostege sticticalis]|uniref:Uncharacterized protein n=1 Tax=Loxostege sticticalis TaxID=481309 RepID=A0ABD0STQ0_LOXSC
MKLTVSLLLLAAAVHAAEVRSSSRSKQKTEDVKTDKRELAEGNSAVEKRAPVLPTVLPSVTPGIEYADSRDSQSEKSPAQQIYATPLPQVAKISDLLSGQGPPFQAAIASHLYAPVSIYQARLGAPTTYEVSNPIPSQLAYSEHKISYQPPQNAIQYSQPVQYNQKQQAPKQQNFARPINYQPQLQQPIFVTPQPVAYSQQPQPIAYAQQPQPIAYAQQPQLVPISQPIYQQIPQFPYQFQRPIQYTQNVAPQHFVQQPSFSQEQQTLVQLAPRPGITYAREETSEEQKQEQPLRQLKQREQLEEPKSAEKQAPAPEKNYNGQPQGAVSYASFSQSQPAPSFGRPSRIQYVSQPQYQAQQLFHQHQPQQPQYQIEIQPQIQPQFQYQAVQNAPSKLTQESIATAATKSLPVNQARQVAFRPGPTLQQLQAQYHQPQVQAYAQEQQVLIQNPNHGAPSFPPVQYFGKYAQSIFGGQHQQHK